MQTVRNGLAAYDLGIIETVAGASGGVRFIPYHTAKSDNQFLGELCERLNSPDRVLPGGMIYMNDLILNPQIVSRLGEIIMQRSIELKPQYIMTVETKGIPFGPVCCQGVQYSHGHGPQGSAYYGRPGREHQLSVWFH